MSHFKTIAVVLLALSLNACKSKMGGSEFGMDENLSPMQRELREKAGDTVHFELDSSAVNEESKEILMKQAHWFKEHPHEKAIIEGHCDERGTREYNLALGERRANAVKKFLKHHGVHHDKIETISYGKERPVALGEGEEVWRQNRRGVTVVVSEQK